jgi:hypothetical protein
VVPLSRDPTGGNLVAVRGIRGFARRQTLVGYALRGAAAAAVVACALWAATFCVAVALVSPMHAFEGGSERVALAIFVAAGTAALALLVAAFFVAWAIWTVDLDAAAASLRDLRGRWSDIAERAGGRR